MNFEALDKQQKKAIRISVDGGVNIDNIASIAKAGADTFVAGSAIFNHAPYEQPINAMRTQLATLPR